MRYEIEQVVVEGLEGGPERAEHLRGLIESSLTGVLAGDSPDARPVDAGLLAAGGNDRVLAGRVAAAIAAAGRRAAR